MALFNWVKPDERKTSIVADAVGDYSGPRTILHALEEAVPRYVSDVDQGTLIYPACKRTRSDKDGDVGSVWDQTRLEAIRYVMPASKPRKDEERETRQAIIEDADKTEGKDRDLVHGDGGTLGLGRPEDLSHDD
jgi:hypothetical protein